MPHTAQLDFIYATYGILKNYRRFSYPRSPFPLLIYPRFSQEFLTTYPWLHFSRIFSRPPRRILDLVWIQGWDFKNMFLNSRMERITDEVKDGRSCYPVIINFYMAAGQFKSCHQFYPNFSHFCVKPSHITHKECYFKNLYTRNRQLLLEYRNFYPR